MKLLFIGLDNNFYNPARGKSYEYHNFYSSFKALPGVEVLYMPFDRILAVGKKEFNREVLAAVRREKPDLMFVFMFSDEFEPDTLDEIKKRTTSAAWFADDSWRFWNYTCRYARHFTWGITTCSWMPPLYKRAGQPNVIRSQWAANTAVYKPLEHLPHDRPDVGFVGGWSKPRADMLTELEQRGVKVDLYGKGWPKGFISEEEMIRLFGTIKINLGLNPSPGYFNKNSLGRLLFRHSLNTIVPDFHIIGNVRSWLARGIPQIKGRHFEVPACGGLLFTSLADDLDTLYVPGREMVIYHTMDDCAEKIAYYLEHDAERETIARAGYERTLREHTWEKRFTEIFQRIGCG